MKKHFLFLLFLGGTIGVHASDFSSPAVSGIHQQQVKVKGTVKDAAGEPIIGASVRLKDTSQGTVTDFDGNFELDAPAGAIIEVSYIGYKSIEVKAGTRHLNLTIETDNTALNEVLVVGYGTQKKATVTGSVSQIGGDELKKVGAVNITNTLAGKTAGVIANMRTGEPGEDNAEILIRGKGTLGSTAPLIVVDGIADRSFSRLNPDDIESISILKDASAAIYGARAANGVILVTTKRGKQGKMQVSYSGNVSFSQPTRVPEMLNSLEYATYVNEYDANPGHQQQATYSQEVLANIAKVVNGQGTEEDIIKYPNTNWWDAVTRNWATTTQHSISVNGGNDKVSFYTSAQYLYQDVIYKNSPQDYNQYQFTTNIDAQVTKAIHFSIDILGRQEKRNRGVYSTEDMFTYFLTTNPMSAPYYPNGLVRVGYDGVTNNAAVMISDIPGTNESTYSTLNIKPRVKVDLDVITKGLYVEGYAALDFNYTDGKQMNHPYDLWLYNSDTKEYQNRREATGNISVGSWFDKARTITLNARLGYKRDFAGGHRVDAFVAYEQSKYDYNYLYGYRTNFLSTAIPELFAGSDADKDKDNNGYSNTTTRQNYFGRINYSYMDKYLAEVTLRYDGSMNFAPGKRWGLFPAFSAGWVISEEPFYQGIKPIMNFFKLKGSWGMMGNDNITAYQYVSQYKFGDTPVMFGEEVQKAMYEARTANPDVTWETAKTMNIGFQSQFLDGKFSFDFDYFNSRRSDILITRNASVPYYSGLKLPAENLGKVKNHGVEIIASYHDKAGDFNWGVTGTFTYAKNEVIYMDEAESTPEWQRQTGHPLDGYVLYKALGIYQTQEEVDNTPHIAGAKPGDLIYQDTNGDGNITWDDAIRSDANPIPKVMYGLTLNGGWKGIDLSVFFQGQADADILAQPTMNMPRDFYEGRWIESASAEERAAAKWPRALIKQTYGDTWNGSASTWWLRSASFIRLKSLELGYTLPKNIISKIGLSNLRVYVNGSNLFTIDDVKIFDPEMTNGIKGYPLNRTWTFGLNVSF